MLTYRSQRGAGSPAAAAGTFQPLHPSYRSEEVTVEMVTIWACHSAPPTRKSGCRAPYSAAVSRTQVHYGAIWGLAGSRCCRTHGPLHARRAGSVSRSPSRSRPPGLLATVRRCDSLAEWAFGDDPHRALAITLKPPREPKPNGHASDVFAIAEAAAHE